MRDFAGSERFASIMRSGVFLLPPVSAGVLEPLKKMGRAPGLKKVNKLIMLKTRHTHFCNGSNTPARAAGGRKNATTHNRANRSLLGSRASVFTPIENVWRRLMNMLMSWENKVGKIRKKYQNSL